MEVPELIIHDIEEEARRTCLIGVEEARSEVRLVEVEISVPLA